MNRIDELIVRCRKAGCSDLHLTFGLKPMVRINGQLKPMADQGELDDNAIREYMEEMLESAQYAGTRAKLKDIDFCYESADQGRNRVNIWHQQRHPVVAIRLLNAYVPTLEEIGMSHVFKDLTMLKRGMVLVTGPTGSGKSTTLAACINQINEIRNEHIITAEDPVEYLHTDKRCMINQREIGVDSESFVDALRSALREDPDIILVGEMRDLETISAAVTAAETGHLVFSTLHTTGAAATIDRIIDVFPPYQQQQIRVQLASVLKAVVSQQLVPRADGRGRVAAQEVLLVTDAVANMIRENKCHQIASVLQTNTKLGMQAMDAHLTKLVEDGVIAPETAVDYGIDKGMLMQKFFN